MSESENKRIVVFNYLIVVVSILLGFGLGKLLVGYAQLIQIQSLVISGLYVGWVLLLFPLYVIYWWSFWDYRKQVRWTFIGFSYLLIGPICLYLVTVLLLPDLSNKIAFDAGAHLQDIRRWFFGLWVILQIWGILLSPWLKAGFKRKSFLNHYKYAQYILLLFLVAGFLAPIQSIPLDFLDKSILAVFWLALIYLLSAHRWILKTK